MATVYDHLRDETGVETVLTGRPPKKGNVSIEYTGTVADFMAWLETTFKDYKDLPIHVRTWTPEGPATPVGTEERYPAFRAEIADLATRGHITTERVEAAFGDILTMVRSEQKINAIKEARALAQIGLKEAKDWVEAIAAKLPTVDR